MATSSQPAQSADAMLSGLTLSGVDFGTFASGTTSYTAEVASSLAETTVTPTVNHSEASYVIKLGGVEDADGVVPLAAGSNVITIEVTAEDDNTTRTYTVTVTRLVSLQQNSTDATLSALTLSSVDFGTFASGTTSYTAQVANSVSQTTVTPTENDSGASYVVKLGSATDADGVVALSVGSNVITIEVTAEDDSTTRTYTVTVTRAAPPSTDATLSALTLSSINFGTFDSETLQYTAQVANSVTQTTITPTVNHSGASYVIKLGGVEDSDGTVSLASGSNVLDGYITEPRAIELLMAKFSGGIRCSESPEPETMFHAKTYCFDDERRCGQVAFLIGSSNLSSAGLIKNREAGLLLRLDTNEVDSARGVWESWWQQTWTVASPATPALVAEYATRFRRSSRPPAPDRKSGETEEQGQTAIGTATELWLGVQVTGGASNQLELPREVVSFFQIDPTDQTLAVRLSSLMRV